MEKCTYIFIYWRRLFEWRINGDLQNLNLFLFTEGASLNGEIMEISIPFSAKGATLNGDCTFIFILWRRQFEGTLNGVSTHGVKMKKIRNQLLVSL